MSDVSRRNVVAAAGVVGVASGLSVAAPAKAAPKPPKAPAPVQVYLTRHGQSWLNLLDRVQGWTDAPLTAAGEQVAATVGTNLGKEVGKFVSAYSGDMIRHYSTAKIMLAAANSTLEPTRTRALREVAFGGFEGDKNGAMWAAVLKSMGFKTIPEMLASGATIADFINVIPTVNPVPALPAETSHDVGNRATKALFEMANKASKMGGGNVLAVSSGLTIACVLIALGASKRIPSDGIHNGAVNQLTYFKGQFTVVTVNDTHFAH